MKALANERGIIAATAMDQRGNLQKALSTVRGVDVHEITPAMMKEFKVAVSRILTPHASAILLDPEFGLEAGRARAANAGLLLAYELSGYDTTRPGRLPDLLPHVSVKRLLDWGADAVKILIYYSPSDDPAVNDSKYAFMERIGAECETYELPFFLEIVGYDPKGGDEKGLEYARHKPEIVKKGMEVFSRPQFRVDVMKVEVPINAEYVEGSSVYKGQKAYTRAEALTHFREAAAIAVKPFIYLTALETGRYTAATVVQDQPVQIKLQDGTLWKPENFTRQTYGPVPLVRALAESLNLATIGVGMDVGIAKVAQTLQRFGLERPVPQVPSMLLGTLEVTPIEAAQLYNGLANGGFRSPLRAVRAVISEDGKKIKAFPLEVTPVAAPEAVYALDRMMEQVMEHGTGRSAHLVLPNNLVVAGKSGTSSDLRDSWFAGFSGSHVVVVWVGYDDDLPTGLTGSAGALPVWTRIMAGLEETSWDAPMPESLAEAWIDYPTGLKVEKGCTEDAVPIAVPVGTELPVKAGCSQQPNSMQSIVERAGEWLRDMMHR